NIAFDDRKNVVNPLNGNFIQFQNWFFREGFGGRYRYTVYRLDARKYINTTKAHTLALNVVVDHRQSPEDRPIPFRGLARFGGADLMRGYFFGTYQADKMLLFQSDYRFPIVDFGPKFPVFDRFGMVVFFGAGQVAQEWDQFEVDGFRMAAGAGIRLSLDKAQRLNLGIDYGIGFDTNSGGEKRQTGFYFFMGETF
ncbi:MAG: BamA/TamA family outer membrane protein, partial [Bacteroidota bacterium]